MSVDQSDVVDIVSFDPRSGCVILTISDHLDWSDTTLHQQTLQNKLNAYLAFVEGGQLIECYPEAAGRQVVFDIVFKHRPDFEGRLFLEKASEVIKTAGFVFRSELFAESWNN